MAFRLFPKQPPVSPTPLIPLQAALKTDRSLGRNSRQPHGLLGTAIWLPRGGASPDLENPHPWVEEKAFPKVLCGPWSYAKHEVSRGDSHPTAIFLSQNHVMTRISPSSWRGEAEDPHLAHALGREGLREKFSPRL